MPSLREKLTGTAVKLMARKTRVIGNEAATKESLIKPFFESLGWDTTDPDVWRPEYDADFNGRKKGEKVDYAILKNKIPIMLIEAKPYQKDTKSLISKDGQLSRYFNATVSAKLSIITNGIIFRFFTDIDTANIQDQEPFTTVDIDNLNDDSMTFLEMLTPQNFNEDNIQEWAKKQLHENKAKEFIQLILTQPSSIHEFVKMVLSNSRKGAISKSVIEAFGLKLNSLMHQAINEMMALKFKQSFSDEGARTSSPDNPQDILVVDASIQELTLFHSIQGIIAGSGRDAAAVRYKNFPHWFSIKRAGSWFLKFYPADRTMLLRIPFQDIASDENLSVYSPIDKGNTTLLKIDNKEIFSIQNVILKTFDFVSEQHTTDEQDIVEESEVNSKKNAA